MRRISLTLLALAALPAAALANGQPAPDLTQLMAMIDAQQRQIDQLRAEVERLRAAEAARPATPPPVAAAAPAAGSGIAVEQGDVPGSFRIPGTRASLKIGGRVKGEVIYTMDDIGEEGSDQFVVPALSSRDESERDGDRVRLHARGSRLNVDVSGPSEIGDWRMFIEGDFFGSGSDLFGDLASTQALDNGYAFRLRHAYAKIGGFTVGQTDSTFSDPDSKPETLDELGPGGRTELRQAQLRYTYQPTEQVALAVALENPEFDPVVVDGAEVDSSDHLPDFTAHARYEDAWGHLQLSGAVRKLNNDAPSDDESVFSYVGGLTGRIWLPFLAEGDSLQAGITGGRSPGRYLLDAGLGAGGDAFVTDDGKVHVIDAVGGFAAITHYWTPTLRSNVIGSYVENYTGKLTRDESFDSAQYYGVNLIWTPIENLDVGLEYVYGIRTDEDGQEGAAGRLQSALTYRF